MSLMGFLSKQFIDVIEWTEDAPGTGPGTLAWRFPMAGNEIQNGGVLTVRESQMAMFVNEGRVADVFKPGRYTLATNTLPILTYLQNWDKAFQSPFKSDVVFFSTRDQVDQKWGTFQPVTVRDKDFGPLRVRANGTFSFRVADPATVYARLSATSPRYTVDDAAGQLRAAVTTAVAAGLGGGGVPFLDMAAQQGVLFETLLAAVKPAFSAFGLELTTFYVQSLSLPEEVQEHLDRRSSMGAVGDLNRYAQFEAADSLRTAAANPGGLAGAGASLAAGLAVGQAMTQGLGQGPGQPAAPVPAADPIATIERLAELVKKGILPQAEFDAKRAELLQQVR